MSKNKYLITQSLLSAWNWIYKSDNGYEDFLKTLHRKKTKPNQAMLDGQQFENMVTAACEGASPPEGHKWEKGILGVTDYVRDGAFQVKLSRNMRVFNVNFVLYGILDVLKSGIIYDIKFSKTYHYGKYADSPQHPMYFALCPEARRFTYIISDGKEVYREPYRPDEVQPIEKEIAGFLAFLEMRRLSDVYFKNWKSKY